MRIEDARGNGSRWSRRPGARVRPRCQVTAGRVARADSSARFRRGSRRRAVSPPQRPSARPSAPARPRRTSPRRAPGRIEIDAERSSDRRRSPFPARGRPDEALDVARTAGCRARARGGAPDLSSAPERQEHVTRVLRAIVPAARSRLGPSAANTSAPASTLRIRSALPTPTRRADHGRRVADRVRHPWRLRAGTHPRRECTVYVRPERDALRTHARPSRAAPAQHRTRETSPL